MPDIQFVHRRNFPNMLGCHYSNLCRRKRKEICIGSYSIMIYDIRLCRYILKTLLASHARYVQFVHRRNFPNMLRCHYSNLCRRKRKEICIGSYSIMIYENLCRYLLKTLLASHARYTICASMKLSQNVYMSLLESVQSFWYLGVLLDIDL